MCFIFLFRRSGLMEDCRFSFVTFRQSSGMLNYTSTVNSCLAGFGVCLSLSLSLSGEWNGLQKSGGRGGKL